MRESAIIDGIHIYENQTALPRAWVVGEFEVEGGSVSALDRLATGQVDPRRVAILERVPATPPAPQAAGGSAAVVEESFDRVVLRAESPADGILVLADPYYPGWRARLDGEAVEILRADHALRAIELPAGQHEIVFEFAGGGYRAGVLISRIGLNDNVLKMRPPMPFSKQNADLLLATLGECLHEMEV